MEQITINELAQQMNFLKQEIEKLKISIREEIEFAVGTEAAYQRHEAGDFIEMNAEDFKKELEKW